MRLRERTLRGGPLDGQAIYISAIATEFTIATPASLEDQLAASLKLAERGLAAVPAGGSAVYRLNATTDEFEYQEPLT
jgi:hypothetical protein